MNHHEPQGFLPQNRCFVRGFRPFSSHLTKCHACHGICTLSPLDAALTMRFAKNSATRLKCCACHAKRQGTSPKRYTCHEKCHSSSENDAKVLTRYEARLNVTKCHACHAKRSYATFGTSKSDPFCRTRHGHGHSNLARTVAKTVANGCDRKRNVERTHPQPPDPQSETGTLATHSGIITF